MRWDYLIEIYHNKYWSRECWKWSDTRDGEYYYPKVEDFIRERGENGWELVQVERRNVGRWWKPHPVSYLYFKRKKHSVFR